MLLNLFPVSQLEELMLESQFLDRVQLAPSQKPRKTCYQIQSSDNGHRQH